MCKSKSSCFIQLCLQVINDLLDDLSRLDSCEKLALRGLNNNQSSRAGLTKQSSVMSGGSSRGSHHDSLLIDNQQTEKVSLVMPINKKNHVHICL